MWPVGWELSVSGPLSHGSWCGWGGPVTIICHEGWVGNGLRPITFEDLGDQAHAAALCHLKRSG